MKLKIKNKWRKSTKPKGWLFEKVNKIVKSTARLRK